MFPASEKVSDDAVLKHKRRNRASLPYTRKRDTKQSWGSMLLVRPPDSSSITRISELLFLFILPQMEDGVGAETNESPIAWLKH